MTLLGVTPFADVSPLGIAAMMAIFAFAFFLKGIFGLGAVPALIVLGSLVVTPHHAILLAAVANLITHLQYVPESLRDGDRRLALGLLVYIVPAVVAGVWVFHRIDGDTMAVVTGSVMLLIIAAEARGIFQKLAHHVRDHVRLYAAASGSFSGFLVGLIGSGGMVAVSPYVRVFRPDKRDFRATILLLAGALVAWRTLVLAVSGAIGWAILAEALLLAPVSILAGWLGGRMVDRVPATSFFQWYQVLLATGAVVLLARGLGIVG